MVQKWHQQTTIKMSGNVKMMRVQYISKLMKVFPAYYSSLYCLSLITVLHALPEEQFTVLTKKKFSFK